MIRKYQADDLNALLEVWYRASQSAHSFLDEQFLRRERADIVDIYLPAAETWVYCRAGRVVGFISLIGNEVGAIFVEPSVQRQGIGRALMDHVRSLREELVVDVFKANQMGRRFYELYGFVLEREHVHEQTGQLLLRLRLRHS